jgi:hypothetical protein
LGNSKFYFLKRAEEPVMYIKKPKVSAGADPARSISA